MLILDAPKNALLGAKTFHGITHGANRIIAQAVSNIFK
jgi:hypothetical protein